MSDALKAGLTSTRRYDIDEGRTLDFWGDDGRVYSTPKLLHDIEVTCRDLLLEHLEEGKDSVGTRVELDHLGATLQGMWVEITVTVTEVNGGAVTFEFSAKDNLETVAKGTHSRFVVGVAKTIERLQKKLAKAQAEVGA